MNFDLPQNHSDQSVSLILGNPQRIGDKFFRTTKLKYDTSCYLVAAVIPTPDHITDTAEDVFAPNIVPDFVGFL